MPAASILRTTHQNNIECQRLEKQYAKRRGNHNNGHHHFSHQYPVTGMANNGVTMRGDRKSECKSPSNQQQNILSQHFQNNNLHHSATTRSTNLSDPKMFNLYPSCEHMDQRNYFRVSVVNNFAFISLKMMLRVYKMMR